jgi:hypothetical protein
LNLFNQFIPSDLPFKNISYVSNAYGAFIYIVHHLGRMTNNMGQTFGREKHFHVHITLKYFCRNLNLRLVIEARACKGAS